MKKEMSESEHCCHGHGMKIIALVVMVLLAGILVVSAFTAGVMNSNNPADQRMLSVSGNVEKKVAPDKVDIVLSVETLNKSAQKSQSDNAVIAEKVKTALQSFDSFKAEVKTVSYSVNEEFEWNKMLEKSESVGYRTVNQIQVTLNGDSISRAGTVIDAAVQAGANRVSSIAFGLSKDKELEVRKIALNEAASVAKTKAQSIAEGLGIRVGKVSSVSESSFYYVPNYINSDFAKAEMSGSAQTPITAGDVSVSASVSVAFDIN